MEALKTLYGKYKQGILDATTIAVLAFGIWFVGSFFASLLK